MTIGYLLKDTVERYNLKRGWFVQAWRVVDKSGMDLFQPWSDTRKEAMDTAEALGIQMSTP